MHSPPPPTLSSAWHLQQWDEILPHAGGVGGWGGGERRSFPNGGRLVRIRATGAVKSTPDEVTSSPSQVQRFTDLPTSPELSPLTPQPPPCFDATLPLSLFFSSSFEVHISSACFNAIHPNCPPSNFMFQAKLADFITIQVKSSSSSKSSSLKKKKDKKRKKQAKKSRRMSAQGEAGAKGLTVASRNAGPTLAANPRGI